MTTLRGQPLRLDVVYRPMAWALLLPPACALSAWWFCLGRVWIAPVPIAIAIALHTLVFWIRGDRPCTVQLSEDQLRFTDVRKESMLAVARSNIHHASLVVGLRDDGFSTVLLSVWGQDGPSLAIRARAPLCAPEREEVDSALLSAVTGGDGDSAYAFAPMGAVCRQLVLDPSGALLNWYRKLPEALRSPTVIRAWQGLEPPLDVLGRHEAMHTGCLRLDHDGLHVPGRDTVDPTTWTLGHAHRSAVIIGTPDSHHPLGAQQIPLVVIDLDGTQLAFPASLADDLGPRVEIDEHTWHTHTGEGNALLYHLLRCTPRNRWPGSLAQSIEVARSVIGGPSGVVG